LLSKANTAKTMLLGFSMISLWNCVQLNHLGNALTGNTKCWLLILLGKTIRNSFNKQIFAQHF